MDWRTVLQVSPSKNKISLSSKIFTIGSCFSDEIGQLLLENKFTVSKNPFGTVYNPISIHKLVHLALDKDYPEAESYSANGDVHFNYHFHSSFSSLNKNDLELKVRTVIENANGFLKTANRVIITYGTAFIYQLRNSDSVVANCHKMPSANFEKRLLADIDIVQSFEIFYTKLKALSPNVKIILTVSPVRHLKDTLELNAVSKSILRVACHTIVNKFADVDYFPAYEILLDDLRDYRFYKTDLLHPSEEAVEYIWEKFVDSYFDNETKRFILEWKKTKKELTHRPFHLESEQHQKFLRSLLSKLESLQTQVDVAQEIKDVKSYFVSR